MARHCARIPWPRYDRNSRLGLLPAALLALLLSGCGVSPEQEPAAPPKMEGTSSLGVDTNDMSANGLGTNGLGTNGLGTNGLGTNGLATSGLSISTMNGTEFVTWFNQDPALANMVMRYIVICAVTEGSDRAWTNPSTGVQYTWHGSLGLTPAWASGSPASEVEQQIITACLAAHANKYGLQVPFSIQGLDATGTPIPVGANEFNTYSQREACFFGNLFQGEGIFAGNDAVLAAPLSSVRACGLETGANQVDECPPIHDVGPCHEFCVPDAQNHYYLSCNYNGRTYRTMTTRIRSADIFTCGDGVCQISESCGTGLVPGSCRDCGPCR